MAKKKKGSADQEKKSGSSNNSTISDLERLFFHSKTADPEQENDGGWADEGFGLSSLDDDDVGMVLDANEGYSSEFRIPKPYEHSETKSPKKGGLLSKKPSLGNYDQFLQQMDEQQRKKREEEALGLRVPEEINKGSILPEHVDSEASQKSGQVQNESASPEAEIEIQGASDEESVEN